MRKYELLREICDAGVIAVLRGRSADDVREMAERAIAGGIRVVEITMTTPGALDAIRELAARYADGKTIVGAGTVLDAETARAAMLSGAAFVVSPSFHPETVKMCNRYRVPVMPGVMTLGEIQAALELGVDVMKLFPGQLFSPSFIRAVKGPMPQVNLMPTGGVSLDNLAEWIRAGAVAVGIGSALTDEAVKTGDYSRITAQAARFVEAYRTAAAYRAPMA